MAKRLDPEVKILQLFDGLSDDGKRITLALLKAKVTTPHKTATKRRPTASTDPASTRAAENREHARAAVASRVPAASESEN